ncbi:DegT/DnrJ/EryC1/StrS family aminotransferase [Rhizobium acidisoli]|uniref:DegT/DnrJ/EryC1/StrS family aminotransferase n=1 Tax=Rhizobium acidisoli TaxID=1538158 RepID=A0AAE5TYZ3_9HYPH|nr:DegT/DnrJ/EryC1/StrS family aminotransferase [Rhizobium acidisoli]KPH09739.1 glutamine--scyllo-inositol aminotransferase [Rhizobium acidisoli]QAS80502.1 DegT/DnrJ/EryC1/StrS family aminotransferase [Rhizobium acidisoli]
MSNRIFYTKPSITQLETDYAADAAANGWGARCYDYLNRFESDFKTYLGSGFAIATSSCTGAMHMGLAALGVGVGDEVILADTNWVATVSPIVHLGATPVFVDVLADSWCIDPEEVERHITPKTKAIIATHLYGNLCDMDALLEIGRRTGIPVIEDAAEAVGSVWHGWRAGSMGTFGTFSFHGTKTLTTGEGGMFVTSDAALYEKVLTLSNHGRARGQTKQFWPDAIGFKYKMSNIQAAIGCAQLERIDDLINRKREILAAYMIRLSALPGITMNPEYTGTVNGAWMPTAVFHPSTGITREMLQQAFDAANTDARVFFYPLSSLSMFEDRPENVNAWSIPERAINLPSYHDMSEADIDRVAATLTNLISTRIYHNSTALQQSA